MNLERQQRHDYSYQALDFVLKSPEIFPGVHEAIVDLTESPEEQKTFVMDVLSQGLRGEKFWKILWNLKLEYSSVDEIITVMDTVTAYVLPNQLLFCNPYDNYTDDVLEKLNGLKGYTFSYLHKLFPNNEKREENIDLLVDNIPKWKIVTKTQGKEHLLFLSPLDEVWEGRQLSSIFSTDGLKKYLDACQGYFYLSKHYQGIEKQNIISYMCEISSSWNRFQESDWLLFQSTNRSSLRESIHKTELERELSGDYDFVFDPQYHPGSNFQSVMSEMKRVYGVDEFRNVPIVFREEGDKEHKIYSYFFGLSPEFSERSIKIFHEAREDLEKVFPDFSEYLSENIRIVSSYDVEDKLRGFTPGKDIGYPYIYIRQTADDDLDIATMRHELIHQYILNKYKSLTENPYIDEGMAEYYGYFEGQPQREVLIGTAREVLKDEELLDNLDPGDFVYLAGMLLISYINEIEGEGEKFINSLKSIGILNIKDIKIEDNNGILQTPGDLLYLGYKEGFKKYLRELSREEETMEDSIN
ncbi:MAG: hypothetical protein ABII80_00190 [bacterium]